MYRRDSTRRLNCKNGAREKLKSIPAAVLLGRIPRHRARCSLAVPTTTGFSNASMYVRCNKRCRLISRFYETLANNRRALITQSTAHGDEGETKGNTSAPLKNRHRDFCVIKCLFVCFRKMVVVVVAWRSPPRRSTSRKVRRQFDFSFLSSVRVSFSEIVGRAYTATANVANEIFKSALPRRRAARCDAIATSAVRSRPRARRGFPSSRTVSRCVTL